MSEDTIQDWRRVLDDAGFIPHGNQKGVFYPKNPKSVVRVTLHPVHGWTLTASDPHVRKDMGQALTDGGWTDQGLTGKLANRLDAALSDLQRAKLL